MVVFVCIVCVVWLGFLIPHSMHPHALSTRTQEQQSKISHPRSKSPHVFVSSFFLSFVSNTNPHIHTHKHTEPPWQAEVTPQET